MLSILICTYNRSEILQECLESCVLHYNNPFPIELIVIDNNSTDSTYDTVRKLSESHDWISYVFEKNVGLSHARNMGYKIARYDWVLYLDDDALIHSEFFNRIQYLIHKTDYQFVGGLHLPWYKYGKPIWFKDRYVSNKKNILPLHHLRKLNTLRVVLCS